jgi:hypothetical protein
LTSVWPVRNIFLKCKIPDRPIHAALSA